VIGFWKVKRWEQTIRPSHPPAPLTAEDIERDRNVRRNIEEVFGFSVGSNFAVVPSNENNRRGALEDARLARDLRAAGLI